MCDCPLLFACRMWKPGQPDNWGHGHDISGEDCGGLIHEALWNDFFCEDLISYICEKELELRMYTSVFHYAPYLPTERHPNVILHHLPAARPPGS